MFSIGFWQLFEQMANCSASQVSDLFGSPAILGPSGGLPWLLGGSEDPWLSVPAFWRVWLFELYVNLSIVVQRQIAGSCRCSFWVAVSTDLWNWPPYLFLYILPAIPAPESYLSHWLVTFADLN